MMKENNNENLEKTETPIDNDCHASSHTDKFVESISLKGIVVHMAHVFNAN